MNVYVDKNGLVHLRKSKNRWYLGQFISKDTKTLNSLHVRYVGKEPKMEVCEIKEMKP